MALIASGIGERGIIDLIWSIIKKEKVIDLSSLVLPPPDDASAIGLGDGSFLVLKTDMFVRRTDAPAGMNHYQMGVKALAMNVSDLAAKGATPAAFLFSLGLPGSYKVNSIKSLIDGMCAASIEYGIPILGGDVGDSKDLVVAGFAAGFAKTLLRRSGAIPGDIIAVTGSFGDTAAALKILVDKVKAPKGLKTELSNSIYMPKARLKTGLAIARSLSATSSMDSSDGLAFTLNEMSRASKTGFVITYLPITGTAQEFARLKKLDPKDLALFGGEEYEIVYTITKEKWKAAKKAAREAGGDLIRIGTVVEGSNVVLKSDSSEVLIPSKGWEHLKK
jgi:thiamine-monophosphate kinase